MYLFFKLANHFLRKFPGSFLSAFFIKKKANFLPISLTEIGPLFNVVKFQGTPGLKFLVLCFYLFLPDVSLMVTYRVFYRLFTVILQL